MLRKPHFLSLIKEGKFKDLFITELGWNRYRGQSYLPTITVDDINYNIETIAERNGFQILFAEVDDIPTQTIARKLDTKLRRQAQDYILILRLRGSSAHDLWIVPIRTNEKRDIVVVEYDNGNAEVIYQKIDGLTFELGEETNIVDLRAKVQSAFTVNSEKITKDFYKGFKKQHKAFTEFITGIDDHIEDKENRNKQWYTSVMLNRLMFCYFIQKKGFLNFDTNYLKKRLDYVREKEGENKFYNFYRSFLCQLFSDGLNSPRHTREFEQIFGKIPYLNGGIFDRHQLELEYPDIDISDEAFINLFDFFDKWNWHLDTRITASGKDINPDVLGYIFEQYINDRAQMGAYYTKEDITEYIGRNCILPFLFDKVGTSRAMSDYFKPDGFVWQTLRNSGDKYIFDAVKKGYKDFNDIPDDIRRGIITEAMRKEYSETPIEELPEDHVPLAELRASWNRPTPEKWGLPTEIWRETIERLQRCDDILHKIENEEITSINDFITYNLDIRAFALDLLSSADRLFVKHFYEALQNVSILDPTCGSGAFLFAAMNILEPLYEVCIDRMQEDLVYFKQELSEITDKYRSNIQYFIFKSIILRNLYGVDIMVEATEIAKLRLFLKMVAVVDVDRRADNLGLDPLPDIDFNIRCGNTLVGYANQEQLYNDLSGSRTGSLADYEANLALKEKLKEELPKTASAEKLFKEIQLKHDEYIIAFKEAKNNLNDRLYNLNSLLNQRLFIAMTGYSPKEDEDITKKLEYRHWLKTHQPFNWLSEFYQIIQGNGGFDVIIGNPPYVEISKNEIKYVLPHSNYKDLYAYVMERARDISKGKNYIGFIIPISFNTTPGFKKVYNQYNDGQLFISCFADSAKLFQVSKRLSIILKPKYDNVKGLYLTRYIKTNQDTQKRFANSPYFRVKENNINFDGIPPKISFPIENKIISRYFKNTKELSSFIIESTSSSKIYYTRAIRNFRPFYDFIPYHTNPDGSKKIPTETKFIKVSEKELYNLIAVLNASITFIMFSYYTDVRNINPGLIKKLRVPDLHNIKLHNFARKLLEDYTKNKTTRLNKTNGCQESYYYPVKSKPLIDEIDKVLAKHYGFTDEELDFIINYDIKYRMGDELNNDD